MRLPLLAMAALLAGTAAGGRAAEAADATTSGLILRDSPGAPPMAATLLTSDVRVAVNGPVARVQAVLRYRNPSDAPVVGAFTLALPADAVVEEPAAGAGRPVADRPSAVDGVGPLPVAFGSAQSADAASSGDASGAWTEPVGEIPPHGEHTVRLAYVHRVAFDQGAFRLTVPAALFGPGPEGGESSAEAPPTAGAVTAHLTVDAGFAVATVESPDHEVTVDRVADDRFRATLAGGVRGGDFTLLWDPLPADVPTVSVFTESSQGEDVHLALVMPPSDEDAMEGTAWYQQRPRELLFVVDASSAKAGDRLQFVRRLIRSALDRLGPDDRFTVIGFGTQAQAAFASPRPADAAAIAEALAFVGQLVPGDGAGIADALALATASPADGSAVRQVVLVGRGRDAATVQAQWASNRRYGDARPYVMAVDAAVDAAGARLPCGPVGADVRGAAATQWPERLEACAADLLDARHLPVLTDVTVTVPGAAQAEVLPSAGQRLYLDQPIVLAARAPASSAEAIVVRARQAGRSWEVATGPATWQPADGVAAFWAVMLAEDGDGRRPHAVARESEQPDRLNLASTR